MIIDDAQIGCQQMPMLDLGVSCRADSVPGHSVCIPSVIPRTIPVEFEFCSPYRQNCFINLGGLYCPPLILAGIRWNPGNSWNSRGINFGTGTCQIDNTILAVC